MLFDFKNKNNLPIGYHTRPEQTFFHAVREKTKSIRYKKSRTGVQEIRVRIQYGLLQKYQQ